MRIYAYDCRPPIANAVSVADQFRLACTYQRVLVLVEIKRREVVDKLYRAACPAEFAAYESSSKASENAAAAVRLLRARPGDMLEPDEEMKEEKREEMRAAKEALLAAREAETEARRAWSAARKAATPRLKRRLQMCDSGARARNKIVYNRAGSVGLAWGTRLKVGESVERAAKAALKVGSLPHMPRFDGGGFVAVQLQRGLDPDLALGCEDTRFRIEVLSQDDWHAQICSARGRSPSTNFTRADPNSKRSQRGKKFAIARLRIGSDGERAPVWASWPVVMHRPLPDRAPIKWVSVQAKKVGQRTHWQLLVTVDDEVPPPREEGPTLAVNFGWRNLDGGLRVAYAVGTDGHEEEVMVPPRYVSRVAHVESLRSIRDKIFELAKKVIKAWVEERTCPDWFCEAVRYIDFWRSQKKLAFLLRDWRRSRFEGDESMLEKIELWSKKDRHLWFWEADERAKIQRMRLDFYRRVAARWTSRYARIVTADMDLRDFAREPLPEDAARTEGDEQRRSRTLAAPSILRGAIKNAATMRGAVVELQSARFKTQTCNACAGVFAFDAKHDVEHACNLCGARWDQDANHCRNLLASTSVAPRAGEPLAPSEIGGGSAESGKRQGRWQKRRSKSDVQIAEGTSKSG